MTRWPKSTCAPVLSCLFLAACSASPFGVQTPKDAVTEAQTNPATVPLLTQPGVRFFALCYSSQINEPEELRSVAQEQCPDQGQIELVAQDFFWNGCALFQPTRATYICVPGEPPESAAN